MVAAMVVMGLGRGGARERGGGEDGDEQDGEDLLHGIVLEFKWLMVGPPMRRSLRHERRRCRFPDSRFSVRVPQSRIHCGSMRFTADASDVSFRPCPFLSHSPPTISADGEQPKDVDVRSRQILRNACSPVLP